MINPCLPNETEDDRLITVKAYTQGRIKHEKKRDRYDKRADDAPHTEICHTRCIC